MTPADAAQWVVIFGTTVTIWWLAVKCGELRGELDNAQFLLGKLLARDEAREYELHELRTLIEAQARNNQARNNKETR